MSVPWSVVMTRSGRSLASICRARYAVVDRVVDVEQLEILGHHHLVLLGGERQRVGEMVEQRIAPHAGLDLMEEDPLGVAPQPERRVVSDEVDLVAPARQVEAQLGATAPEP